MSDYWFARRFPVGDKRNAVAPVSREGRFVVMGFLMAMLVGMLFFIVMAIAGRLVLGGATFAIMGGLGGAAFIAASYYKLDRNHTVDDYENGPPTQGTGNRGRR